MLGIILIVFGLLPLIKGRVRISSTKIINRPHSTYLGLVLIVYGVGRFFVSNTLIFSVIFWSSFLVLLVFFVNKGENIRLTEDSDIVASTDTVIKSILFNVFLAIVILIAVIGILYIYFENGGHIKIGG